MSHVYLLVDEELKIFIQFIKHNILYIIYYYTIREYYLFSYFSSPNLQDEAIHASVQAFEARYIADKVEIGSIYKIDNFYVDISRPNFKVVPNPIKITFARNTVFIPVIENIPDIPHNKFNFLEFDRLWPRVDVNEVLTGNCLCPFK